DSRHPESARTHFVSLAELVGGVIVPDQWRIAWLNGLAVGFAVGASHLDGGDHAASGWVLDVGVAPNQRGRGFAMRLLVDIISTLAAAGNTEVKSAIDDLNTASLALHAKLGFERIAGRYMTYEKWLQP